MPRWTAHYSRSCSTGTIQSALDQGAMRWLAPSVDHNTTYWSHLRESRKTTTDNAGRIQIPAGTCISFVCHRYCTSDRT
ncbi:hypothetical protein AFLA_011149 [Aspergillus flavus NRRL3357]|nr:hypothetical protein AFLA_011149 [Aspergillus flavus NRRL3357]